MNNELYLLWKDKYSTAKENMKKMSGKDGVLIEVAAQHPLIDGVWPNEEFEKRLRIGIELYQKYKKQGQNVKIYVPGSLHMDKGVVDKISLSKAGEIFLIENHVAKEDIFAEDMNEKYKGEQGVYNSTDECFVACKIYEELDFKELHCVCSSAQMMRKVLSYIHFGYVPYAHTVSCDEMFHDYIDEIFLSIPILLADENAMQGESDEAERLRRLRMPKES